MITVYFLGTLIRNFFVANHVFGGRFYFWIDSIYTRLFVTSPRKYAFNTLITGINSKCFHIMYLHKNITCYFTHFRIFINYISLINNCFIWKINNRNFEAGDLWLLDTSCWFFWILFVSIFIPCWHFCVTYYSLACAVCQLIEIFMPKYRCIHGR